MLEIKRRTLLLGGLASLAAKAADRIRTPGMTAGPFYPRNHPGERDSNLLRTGTGSAEGVPVQLHGRVLDRRGQPFAGATVEIWQCDARGVYHHPRDYGDGDPRFQGYGTCTTDTKGAYAFTTIRPVRYGLRAPHIHCRLNIDGKLRLTTQLFDSDAGEENAADFLFRNLDSEQREAVVMQFQKTDQPGIDFRGRFDFVVA